jgi:hypothetical protein
VLNQRRCSASGPPVILPAGPSQIGGSYLRRGACSQFDWGPGVAVKDFKGHRH